MKKAFVIVWCLFWLLACAASFVWAANPDHGKALVLVPDEWATHWAAQSGLASDLATWEDRNGDMIGDPPVDGARVVIPAGVTVTQDIDSPKLKTLRIDGTLQPAGNVTLLCETIVVTEGGKLQAGTSTAPFTGEWRIVFADFGPIDTVADPWKFSRGLLALGEVKLYGKEVKPYQLIEGAAAGAASITLKGGVTGWKAGDRIVVPGVQWLSNDDDECIANSITGTSATLATPLRFVHLGVDREGFARPMVAANISPRSIHLESENPAIDRRGHLMFMCGGNVLSNWSWKALGRTDKSKPLTDPDGLGGGLANERGRYGCHFHRVGPGSEESIVSGAVGIDSPGWGFVNHESRVSFLNCVAYRVFGAHFVGENGNETGYMTGNLAIRGTCPPATAVWSLSQNIGNASLNPNANWGRFGHGIWTHCGGITLTDNLVYGMPSVGIVPMGTAFQTGTAPAVQFETANLTPPYTYSKPLVACKSVPQVIEGGAVIGCAGGIWPWALNDNGTSVPLIGRHTIKNVSIESPSPVVQGYLSNLDWQNVRLVNPLGNYAGVGFGHTGVNTDVHYRGCSAYGYATGINCQTSETCSILDYTSKCQAGIHLNNGRGGRPLLNMERLTFIPNGKPGQLGIESRVYLSPSFLRTGLDVAGNLFATFTSATPSYGPDAVRLDGKFVYLSEEAPDFKLSSLKNCPAIFATLTTQQLWDTHRLAFCNRRIPADAVKLAGSDCLVSDNPPTVLSEVRPNKTWGTYAATYYQQTSQTTGFVLRVKDSTGAFVSAPPVDLVPGWNVCKVTVQGVERGVMVRCDPAATFPSPW